MKPLALLVLFLACFSCRNESTLDYQTAYKLSHIDTIRSVVMSDTLEMYEVDFDGLIGAHLPDFTATTIDGKEINKDYFINKVSIINFWFEGCHPCEDEMPVFNQLVDRYKGKDVNFLAIGRNSPDDIKDFLLRSPFNFDHIGYGEPIIVDTFKSTWGYPITFVADKDMKIVSIFRNLGDITKVTDAQMKFTQVIDETLANN